MIALLLSLQIPGVLWSRDLQDSVFWLFYQ
uniref:Uncharacterized protein n=1 Tax=Arundo donax TaxID=35708 RepID=A0A0A8YRG3_ARUDO